MHLQFTPVVFPLVIKAQNRIGCDQQSVEQVEEKDKIKFSGQFVKTSCDVADDDQTEENVTFSRRIFHLDRLDDRKGPAETETNQHEGFKNS